MLRFSPGLAQGCYELLSIINRHKYSASDIASSFSHFGSVHSSHVFSTAQKLNWIEVDQQNALTPTLSGQRLLKLESYPALLQQMLFDYIDIERPSWVQNAISGRSKVLAFSGTDIGQIFIEANLAHGTDDATVGFWDALAARARGLKNQKLNEIGRVGERLSIKYETTRTGNIPKWTAIENNEDGYDLLSVVSSLDSRKLSIEVKASSQGIYGSFYLTRNEWDRALETPFHNFHLWDLSQCTPSLAVLSTEEMLEHLPVDCGKGKWESVKVPFLIFNDIFQSQLALSSS